MAILNSSELYGIRPLSDLVRLFYDSGLQSATKMYLPNLYYLCREIPDAANQLQIIIKSSDEQYRAFCQLIESLPISHLTADAVKSIDRKEFIVEEFRRFWFIDYPLPSLNRSWISSPSIVALMCDRVPLQSFSLINEIGSGCGYHLSIMMMLPQLRGANFVGYEVDPDLARLSTELVCKQAATQNVCSVNIICGDGLLIPKMDFSFTYITCAISHSQTQSLKTNIGRNSFLQAPRPLRSSDLASLTILPDLHEDYLIKASTGHMSALANISTSLDDAFLAPVSFVPCTGSGFQNDVDKQSEMIEWLRSF